MPDQHSPVIRAALVVVIVALSAAVVVLWLMQRGLERQMVAADGETVAWDWTWTPEAQFRAEWIAREQSYASDRPDLSRPLRPGEPERFDAHVSKFFETSGVPFAEVEDVTYAIGEFGRTLVRARLSEAQMARFLDGKLHLEENAQVFLDLVYGGQFEWQHPEDETTSATTDMSDFLGYPFCRLDWWPVDFTDAKGFTVHVGETTWDYWEMRQGADYYVLAGPAGTIYILL